MVQKLSIKEKMLVNNPRNYLDNFLFEIISLDEVKNFIVELGTTSFVQDTTDETLV